MPTFKSGMPEGESFSMKRLLSLICAAIILLPVLAASFRNDVSAEGGSRVIRFANPFYSNGEFDENGLTIDYSMAYLRDISAYTGWRYEYVDCSWEEAVAGMADGSIDITCCVSYTEERSEEAAFTDTSYGQTYTTIFTSDRNEAEVNGFGGLNGMTVGAVNGSASTGHLSDFCRINGIECSVSRFDTAHELIEAVRSGEIGAGVMGYYSDFEGTTAAAKFSPVPYYFVTGLGNKDVLNALDKALMAIKIADPNHDEKLNSLYFKDNDNLLLFDCAELEYINSHEKLRVVYSDSWNPLGMTDKNGNFTGIIADIFSLTAERTGLDFEYVRADTNTEALQMIENGEAEIICGFQSNETAAQSHSIVLTDNYISVPMSIITSQLSPHTGRYAIAN